MITNPSPLIAIIFTISILVGCGGGGGSSSSSSTANGTAQAVEFKSLPSSMAVTGGN